MTTALDLEDHHHHHHYEVPTWRDVRFGEGGAGGGGGGGGSITSSPSAPSASSSSSAAAAEIIFSTGIRKKLVNSSDHEDEYDGDDEHLHNHDLCSTSTFSNSTCTPDAAAAAASAATEAASPLPSSASTLSSLLLFPLSPRKLYSREKETQALVEGFYRCISSSISNVQNQHQQHSQSHQQLPQPRELLLVTGKSGVGKTALIESALKPLVQDMNGGSSSGGGLFVSGKFDLLERKEQYYPIVQALTEYAHLVCACPALKHGVQAALEPHKETTRLLVDLIPALAALVTGEEEDEQGQEEGEETGEQQQHTRSGSSSSLSPSSNNNTHAITSTTTTTGAATHRDRFKFALRQFFQAVCSPTNPLVLFLDDLQWAEPASLDLVASLLCNRTSSSSSSGHEPSTSIRGLVIVGACRDNEMSSLDHLSVLLRELEATNQVTITQIPVDNLTLSDLSNMVSEVFFHHPTTATTIRDDTTNTTNDRDKDNDDSDDNKKKANLLGEIVLHHTSGNMFFVVHVLRTMVEEGLLYKTTDASGSGTSSWAFETEERIRSVLGFCSGTITADGDADDNGVMHDLLNLSIQKQDKAVQDTLLVASCLGNEFPQMLLEKALIDSCYNVPQALQVSEERGFLTRNNSFSSKSFSNNSSARSSITTTTSTVCCSWRFVHDQIQQSAYSLIPVQEREQVHLQIGRKLCRALAEPEFEEHAHVIVKQLRLGAKLLQDQDEREQVAALLLRAGELASQKSAAYLTAQEYFRLAMSLLGNRHWRDQYELSLSLYNAAAEVEYCVGDFKRMDEHIGEILANARCPGDKIRAQTSRMYSLGSRNQLQEAIDVGLRTLKLHFGESFPSRPSALHVILELMKTKRMLRQFSDDEIMALKPMTDPQKLAGMRIMCLLFAYTLNGRPMFAPLISMRLVQHSILHGMSGMSSVGFSSFGMLQCIAFDQVDSGVRYGKVALRVLDKFDAREWLPRVYSAVYGFCFTYKEPLRDQLQPLLLSHRVGLGGGDIEFSLLSAAAYTCVGVFSSIHLSQLSVDVAAFINLTEVYHQSNMAQFLRPNMQFIQNMRGNCEDPSVLDGDALNLELAIMEACGTKNTTIMSMILSLKLVTASYFRQFEKVERESRRLARYGMESFTCFCKAAVWLHEGIASLALSHQQQRRRRVGVAKRNLKRLKELSTHSEHNFANKASLLEAEIAVVVGGHFHQALLTYEVAIGQAKEAKLWGDVGLACERLAFVLQRRGRSEEAIAYLDQAVSAYELWGATAKVTDIRTSMHPELCPL